LALAFAIGKFAASRFDLKTARKIFLITLTWSFFIYIGALWGQINTISALLTFLAFYSVVDGRNRLGAFLLGAAVTLKIYPIITLPAFFVYILQKKNKQEAAKFLVYVSAIPVLFTVFVFAIFKWDILFFLRTIFYWTPVFESTAPLVQTGCMNIWSFTALFNIDISTFWILRFVWIPVLALASLYWIKKPKLAEADFNLFIISLYTLFIITYGWVTEQTFLDLLPFIFLQIVLFRPKKIYFYFLIVIQILVYSFSAFNGGLLIFQPMVQHFYPTFLVTPQTLNSFVISLAWTIRGTLGLIISIFLGLFLIMLINPSFLRIRRS
jgi:hypothetical protein